jgi:hypothetical protein
LTRDVDGLSVALGRIPDVWVGKTLDVCNFVGVYNVQHAWH